MYRHHSLVELSTRMFDVVVGGRDAPLYEGVNHEL